VTNHHTRSAVFAAVVLAAASASPAAPENAPDGVTLVDSCGTYVRMREGTESYQASQLERTRLCSDLLWATAQELKGQVLGSGDRRPSTRGEYVRCELDPRPMGPHQSVRVAYRYLTLHPELLHLPAQQLARDALRSAFGCEPVTDG